MSDEFRIIKEKITQNKGYLQKTYGIEEIGVFGSVIHKKDSPLSDIDILFTINEKRKDAISIFDLVDMKSYLEGVLGKTVDIVEKVSIKPLFRSRILNEVVMI